MTQDDNGWRITSYDLRGLSPTQHLGEIARQLNAKLEKEILKAEKRGAIEAWREVSKNTLIMSVNPGEINEETMYALRFDPGEKLKELES